MEGKGEMQEKRVTLKRFKGERMRGCKKFTRTLGGKELKE